MKKNNFFWMSFIVLLILSKTSYAKEGVPVEHKANYGIPSFVFFPNLGQVVSAGGADVSDIKFYSKIGNATIFFQKDKLSFVFQKEKKESKQEYDVERIDFKFLGCRHDVEIITDSELRFNYFNSVNHVKLSKVYQKIVYKQIYKGIDLCFYFHENNLKYDFLVHKGADPSQIAFIFEGCASLELNKSKGLDVLGNFAKLTKEKPFTYYEDNRDVEIPSEYKLKDNAIKFSLSNYDDTKSVVIDPVILLWGDYIGSTGSESPISIDVNSYNDVFVTGIVNSSITFPGIGTSTYFGSNDAFIAKFDNTSGDINNILVFGGTGNDGGIDLVINASDEIFVMGYTNSSQCSVATSSFSTSLADYNTFLLKLTNSLNVVWFGFYGDAGNDGYWGGGIGGIDINPYTGNIFVTAATNSASLPNVSGKFQTGNIGGVDCFIAEFDGGPSYMNIWSTFYGSTDADLSTDIKVGMAPSYDLNIVGFTKGSIASIGTKSTTEEDGFVLKMNNTGTSALNNVYYNKSISGTRCYDYLRSLTLATNGNIYIGGYAANTTGGFLGIVLGYNSNLSLLFETNINGVLNTLAEAVYTIDLDNTESYLYVGGEANSDDLPYDNQTVSSFIFGDHQSGSGDGFIAKINLDGTIASSSFVGSSYNNPFVMIREAVSCTKFNNINNLLICGVVASGLPYNTQYDPSNQIKYSSFTNTTDGFLFEACVTPDNPRGIFGPDMVCVPKANVRYKVIDPDPSVNYSWQLPNNVMITGHNSNYSEVDLDFSSIYAPTTTDFIEVYAIDPSNSCGPSGVARTLVAPVSSIVLCNVIKEFPALRILPEGPSCVTSPFSQLLEMHPSCSLNTKYTYTQFQWLRNSIPIPGANSERFFATQTGIYQLQSFDGCGNAVYSQEVKLREVNLLNYDQVTYSSGYTFPTGITTLNAASNLVDGFVFGGMILIPSGADVTIDASSVKMDNCAHVAVASGGKLTITNSDLFACQNPPTYGWMGIEVSGGSGSSAGELVISGSIISDAVAGIASSGKLDIQNSTFYNNITDMFVWPDLNITTSLILNNSFLLLREHPYITYGFWPNFNSCIPTALAMYIQTGVFPIGPIAAHIIEMGAPTTSNSSLYVSNNQFYGRTFPNTTSGSYTNYLGSVNNYVYDNAVYFTENSFSNLEITNNKIYNHLYGIQVMDWGQSSTPTNPVKIEHNLLLENGAGILCSPSLNPLLSGTSQSASTTQIVSISCNKFFDCEIGILGSGPIVSQGMSGGSEWENMFVCNQWELLWENNAGLPITIWNGSSTTLACNNINSITPLSAYTLNGAFFPNGIPPFSDIIENFNSFLVNSTCRATWKRGIEIGIDKEYPVQQIFLKTYPNPSNETLNICLTIDNETFDNNLIIYDSYGSAVFKSNRLQLSKNNPLSIDITDWSSGQYFLKIITKEGIVIADKFIVLKEK